MDDKIIMITANAIDSNAARFMAFNYVVRAAYGKHQINEPLIIMYYYYADSYVVSIWIYLRTCVRARIWVNSIYNTQTRQKYTQIAMAYEEIIHTVIHGGFLFTI